MKKAFTLAVLLCLYTPAVAAELYAKLEPLAPLVEAIARQESGLNPLAVNIAGKSLYPATREEAKQLIRKAIAAGQSFDVGKFQINSWWMERLTIDPFSLLDPATNERWGKRILAGEIARHGLNWKAVGKYHSPDPERGRRYAWLIYRHYAGLRASKIQEAPCAEQKIDSQNLSDPRGTRTDQSISQQGRAVPFHVQQKGVPWIFRPKSGTSGGKD
ncbi:hypothetical protein K050079A111_32090 [Bilophila wadsworthia]|jgi:hypothetical protein